MNVTEGAASASLLLPDNDMFSCTDNGNLTALERQMARFKWQQQQQLQQFQVGQFSGDHLSGSGGFQLQQQQGLLGGFCEFVKPDPSLVMDDNVGGWADHDELMGLITSPNCAAVGTNGCVGNGINGPGFELNYAISRTNSCPPPAAASAAVNGGESLVAESSRESSKKRKFDKIVEEEREIARDKRTRGCGEDKKDSKIAEEHDTISNSNNSCSNRKNKSKANNGNTENSGETSKDKSKVTEDKKPDYIHVRARRGQATDNHSLAERVRREKISQRMKYLQDLVPGCNKITGKAGMLDEIINYVQSLQRQVEFLSMKLAAITPRHNFNIDNLFSEEAFQACAVNLPTIGMSSDMNNMTNPAYHLRFGQVQQPNIVSCHEMNMATSIPLDMGLRRTISAPTSTPETFVDASCLTQMQASTIWDGDLTNLYNVAFNQRSSFQSQQYAGPIRSNNLKMEI